MLNIKGCLGCPKLTLVNGIQCVNDAQIEDLKHYVKQNPPFLLLHMIPSTRLDSRRYMHDLKDSNQKDRHWHLAQKASIVAAHLCELQVAKKNVTSWLNTMLIQDNGGCLNGRDLCIAKVFIVQKVTNACKA